MLCVLQLNEDMEEEAEKIMESVVSDSTDATLEASVDVTQPGICR